MILNYICSVCKSISIYNIDENYTINGIFCRCHNRCSTSTLGDVDECYSHQYYNLYSRNYIIYDLENNILEFNIDFKRFEFFKKNMYIHFNQEDYNVIPVSKKPMILSSKSYLKIYNKFKKIAEKLKLLQ